MSARQAPATKPTYPVPITVIFINSLNFDTATKKWCRNSELNQGHRDFQSLALPTELLRHIYLIFTGLVEQALHFPYTFRLSAPLGSYCGILFYFCGAHHPSFYSFLKSRKSIVLAKYN